MVSSLRRFLPPPAKLSFRRPIDKNHPKRNRSLVDIKKTFPPLHSAHAILAGFLCSCAIGHPLHSATADQTLTTNTAQNQSKQFFVQSPDRSLRFDTTGFADQILASWQSQIGPPSSWSYPISVFFSDDPNKKTKHLAQVNYLFGDGNSLRIQLTVFDQKSVGSPELAEWFFHALIGELSSRSTPPALNKTYRTPPFWLTQALVQQWLSKKNPLPTHLLEGILNAPKPPTLSSVLTQKNTTGSVADATVSRLLCLGLLRVLQEQPNGPACFRNLCSMMGEHELNLDAILKAFPSFGGSQEKLERQWILTLARMASSKRTELLTFSETFKQLDKILDVHAETVARNKEKKMLSGSLAFPEIAKQQGGPLKLTTIATGLIQLETRANPMVAPLLRDLRESAFTLARRPKTNIEKKLARTTELLSLVRQAGNSINDTMNAYEVNCKGAPDPQFRLILKTQLEAFTPDPRRDALSRTLDACETK